MSRIVIVVYGSLGDLHPTIALAQGLKARGHHAVIATSEPYRAKITALGIPFRAVRPDLSLSDQTLIRRVMDGTRGSEFLLRKLVYPAVREMYEDLAAIAAETDLFVAGELACAVPILAEKQGVPWAYFALSPVSFLPVFDPSILPGPTALRAIQAMGPKANRFLHSLARCVSHSWWAPLRELRRELGLVPGPSPLFDGKYSPRLNLALFSKALQPAQPDWPPATVQTGFLFHDEEESAQSLPPAVQQFLDTGDAPIVFTLGSAAVHLAHQFYAQSARAAQSLGRRAVLLLGHNSPPPNLPDTILAWDYLPFRRIFPHAAAIVHQGGVGTTAQAMRAGRPMLVVPFAHDQFDNAARVTRLGIARTVAREKYTAETAARELRALLGDTRVTQKSRSVGESIRAENGITAAADVIERTLEQIWK